MTDNRDDRARLARYAFEVAQSLPDTYADAMAVLELAAELVRWREASAKPSTDPSGRAAM
jgi:hypothetical protein